MHTLNITIRSLHGSDRGAWERLARGYHAFDADFATDEEIERTWHRIVTGGGLHALGAFDGERLVGIAHYLVHDHMWHGQVCYLQDLFVDGAERSRGTGRMLIDAVAQAGRAHGCFRLYWVTKHDNIDARRLYASVANDTGYVRYDLPLKA